MEQDLSNFNEFVYLRKHVYDRIHRTFPNITVRWEFIDKKDEKGCALYYSIDKYAWNANNEMYVVDGTIHYLVTHPNCTDASINLLWNAMQDDGWYDSAVELMKVPTSEDGWSFNLKYSFGIPVPKSAYDIKEIDMKIQGEY